MEILAIFFVLLILAVALFWGGPALLRLIVAVGEAIEEKENEWKRIYNSLKNEK